MKNKIIVAAVLTTLISLAIFLESGSSIPEIIAMVLDESIISPVPELPKPSALEIKGIKIGMTEDEAYRKENFDFTIGGVRAKNLNDLPLKLTFHDGKLDRLTFLFTPDGFDMVLEAVKSKYPMLKCAESNVSNVMGASFQQMICMLEGSDSILSIRRFTDNIETSSLTLTSLRLFDELKKQRNDTKKDI
jgi:hypothetical protein